MGRDHQQLLQWIKKITSGLLRKHISVTQEDFQTKIITLLFIKNKN